MEHDLARGIKRFINGKLKQFSVEKFVLHGCDPQKCMGISGTVAQQFGPVYAVTQTSVGKLVVHGCDLRK
jgi:hypothetical protein